MEHILLQPMPVEQIELLIVKSKYIGDNEAEFILHKEIYLRCCDVLVENERIRTIVTIIIASILLDQPLVTQRQYIKSLYKRFGTEANKSKANLMKMKHDLKTVEQRGNGSWYLKAALVERIAAEELALDRYAEEQSLINNHCPRCAAAQGDEISVGCDACGGTGKIAVTMRDAKAFFNVLGLPYTPYKFASEYWSKILFIVSELQIK
ncbi:hypothetical protein [Psychromonas aquimarina]|uniref:hypothetical protein n=1 Tax=Psychromonas aquimarina TaxID=444919 RepID=UPI00042068BF|nr:hypothetical protein [Psychromonas aquimarina]